MNAIKKAYWNKTRKEQLKNMVNGGDSLYMKNLNNAYGQNILASTSARGIARAPYMQAWSQANPVTGATPGIIDTKKL